MAVQPPTVPEMVQWVVDVVVHGARYAGFAVSGDMWPQGDETQLRQLGDHWNALATAVEQAHPELSGHFGSLSSGYGGTAGAELQLTGLELLGFGSDGGLLQLAGAARGQQQVLQYGAMDIELTKYMIIMEALATAISVMYAVMTAYLSFGATTASIPALVGAGRAGVARLAAELVRALGTGGARRYAFRRAQQAGARAAVTRYLPHRLAREGFERWSRRGGFEVAREGVLEAIEESAIAAGAQGLQDWFGERSGWDWDLVRTAGVAGFAGGAGGALVFGGNHVDFGNRFASQQLQEHGWTGLARRSWRGAYQNPFTSGFGGWVATGFEGGLPGLWATLRDGAVSAAVVGATRSGLTLAGGRFGIRISPVQVDPRTGAVAPRPGGAFDPRTGPEVPAFGLPGLPGSSADPAAAVAEKRAARQELAGVEGDLRQALLATRFTPDEARQVVAGVPSAVDAAFTRLAAQDALLAEAGVTGTGVDWLTELVQAQQAAAERNARADDQLAALDGQLEPVREQVHQELAGLAAVVAGGLVDRVAASGVVEEVNDALGHDRYRIRGRRGSVQLHEPVYGAGSARRFSMWVSPGFLPKAVVVTVTEGDGAARADHRHGQVVVRLGRRMALTEANAFVARVVAITVDQLRAGARWQPDQVVLRDGPLPERFQRRPRTSGVTALDVVNLHLELKRPLAEGAAVAQVRAGAARLGLDPQRLTPDLELRSLPDAFLHGGQTPAGVAAALRGRLQRLAGYVPPQLIATFEALVAEIRAEVETGADVDRQLPHVIKLLESGMLGQIAAYVAVAMRGGDPEAAQQFLAEAERLVSKAANRTVDIRWDRIDRWLADMLVTAADQQLLRDMAGRPMEPLGLAPRPWHMLKRTGAVAGAVGFGAVVLGSVGWGLAALGTGIVALRPVVSGFAGRAYSAGVAVTELHRSHPGRDQALPRRMLPSIPVLVARWWIGGSPVRGIGDSAREGARGWRDVFGYRTWARAHAEYTVRELYRGRLPSDFNEPSMAEAHVMAAQVARTVAGVKQAMFRQERDHLTPAERDLLEVTRTGLADLGRALEVVARHRGWQYRQEPLVRRLRQQPPKGLPSGWRHQARRGLVETTAGAVEYALGGAPAPDRTTTGSGGQSLALAEKWVAARRYRTASGVEAAVVSREVREVAAAVARLLDGEGMPERPSLHRVRPGSARLTAGFAPLRPLAADIQAYRRYWPVYQRRGMPDYAAHALRAHMALAGASAAYLALAGLNTWEGRPQLPSWGGWLAPQLPLHHLAIGFAATVGFSVSTKYLDWRYREVKARAAYRLEEAQAMRGDRPTTPDTPAQVADELAALRRRVLGVPEPDGSAG